MASQKSPKYSASQLEKGRFPRKFEGRHAEIVFAVATIFKIKYF